MPFKIASRGNQYVVVTTDTGKVHGRFPTRDMALAQLRALYVNVPEARNQEVKEDKKK